MTLLAATAEEIGIGVAILIPAIGGSVWMGMLYMKVAAILDKLNTFAQANDLDHEQLWKQVNHNTDSIHELDKRILAHEKLCYGKQHPDSSGGT